MKFMKPGDVAPKHTGGRARFAGTVGVPGRCATSPASSHPARCCARGLVGELSEAGGKRWSCGKCSTKIKRNHGKSWVYYMVHYSFIGMIMGKFHHDRTLFPRALATLV